MFYFKRLLPIALLMLIVCTGCKQSTLPAIVLQSDFGIKDGAVAAMKGIILQQNSQLTAYDLTHDIEAYDIWEAAYRLKQTVDYWPAGTVFVSVVDPGVGTDRKSVVALTKNGQYIVTPDNGTLTLLAENNGIVALREINEKVNRLPGSSSSYTFHGRDVYAYTAARLAAGIINFEQVGPLVKRSPIVLPYQPASSNGKILQGIIATHDPKYGNLWTNIPDSLILKTGIQTGDSVYVTISHMDTLVYEKKIPFVHSFGDVAIGSPLAYFNSLMNFSIALNQDNFASRYGIKNGTDWKIIIQR